MDTLFPKRHVPYPRTGNQHLLAAICLFLLQPLLTQNRGTLSSEQNGENLFEKKFAQRFTSLI